ncbi:hypothetical protein [Glycomyces algeriensis]|uniref:Uncharacterized protein n=1 Tax=Glycomyces algeriensis TaxID=256037 RepID=A0A9W6GBR6_9ACTN|nr:hypothetical protein [Glycomyces algeriensis]MDA1365715.1 hypothetical protein [Glycomyces algeriensis]MDR7351403.1 hypothetical protein [Glycomyces algeriensis]GLI44121.1 hypothetical protein GALLR39Z86_39710 [Glycomyces algeriensis]
MNPSAPAARRIRFNPWWIGIFCAAGIIFGSAGTFMRGPELFDLLFLSSWLTLNTLLAVGVLSYMRVSSESVAIFRNNRGWEKFTLRPGDQIVATHENVFIWRREGYYEDLRANPIWTGQRQWTRLQEWTAEHWPQPADAPTRWPSPQDTSQLQ